MLKKHEFWLTAAFVSFFRNFLLPSFVIFDYDNYRHIRGGDDKNGFLQSGEKNSGIKKVS